MSVWALVFWLQIPSNFAEHTTFKNEKECRDAEVVWNQRLHIVKSDLIAECRRKENHGNHTPVSNQS